MRLILEVWRYVKPHHAMCNNVLYKYFDVYHEEWIDDISKFLGLGYGENKGDI